jgi:hypothetical protein
MANGGASFEHRCWITFYTRHFGHGVSTDNGNCRATHAVTPRSIPMTHRHFTRPNDLCGFRDGPQGQAPRGDTLNGRRRTQIRCCRLGHPSCVLALDY